MGPIYSTDQAVSLLRNVVVAMVRGEGPSLSAHQLGVYLACYVADDAPTERSLSAAMELSPVKVARALDRLEDLDLSRRQPKRGPGEPHAVERTQAGERLLQTMRTMSMAAAR